MTKKGTNAASQRAHNRALILLSLIRAPLAQNDLTKETGLTRAAVSVIVDNLYKEGMIREVGTRLSSNGRRPTVIEIKDGALYAVGIDISRSGCSIGISDIAGKIQVKREIEQKQLAQYSNPSAAVADLAEITKNMIGDLESSNDRILGIGITTPGPVNVKSGSILRPPNFEFWAHFPIVHEFEKYFSKSVLLENNSVARAIAEDLYGCGSKFDDFVVITIKSGLGCGIISNHKVIRATYGISGGIAHTTVDINGKQCNCGNTGCLELYALPEQRILEAKQFNPLIETWSDIVDHALHGETQYLDLVDREAFYLATGIINVINMLEPQAVILSGSICVRSELLLARIQKYMQDRLLNRSILSPQLVTSCIGNDVEILAASSVVFDKYLKV